MKTKHKTHKLLFYFFIFIVILTLIPILVYLSIDKPFKVQYLEYDFKIKNQVGFMLDSDILHFGGAPQGSQLQRNITLSIAFPSIVKIGFEGPGNIISSDNNFYLEANKNKSLEFILTTPNEPEGNYSGIIFIEFYKP
ncbi:MAG: hypothetical protein AB7V77_02440 [Candidatus Woesearchaeota archaeon]